MENTLLENTLAWVREQKKRIEKTPIDEIDAKQVQLVNDIEYYALTKLREINKVEVL